MYYFEPANALLQNQIRAALHQTRNKFSIELDRRVDEGLFVYHVHYEDGEHLEAQVFTKFRLPAKMYLARKRRQQRLRNNHQRFITEADTDIAKVIVSQIPREKLELPHQDGPETGSSCAISQDDFPALPCSDGEDTYDKLHGTWNGCQRASFAEVVSTPCAMEMHGIRGGQWKWGCQRLPCVGV